MLLEGIEIARKAVGPASANSEGGSGRDGRHPTGRWTWAPPRATSSSCAWTTSTEVFQELERRQHGGASETDGLRAVVGIPDADDEVDIEI